MSNPSDVVVVGAGLAGLSAALDLADHGLDVVVVEARDRVGGRVWSHRLANGEIVELGGEWISDAHHHVIDLAHRLGLSTIETGMDFASRDPVGGQVVTRADHQEVLEALSERIASIDPDDLGQMTAAKLLEKLPGPGLAVEVLRSRLTGTMGIGLDRVAAAEIGEEFGFDDSGSYFRVQGGNDLLAGRMADDLDVRLNTVAHSVLGRRGGVEVQAADLVVTGKIVIVAVPLLMVRELAFDPPLSPEVVGVLHSLQMGVAVKVAVATSGEPPMFRRQDLDIPAWYWTGRSDEGAVRRAVTGFAGAAPGAQALTFDPVSRVARAAPEVSFDGPPIVVDWRREEFIGGSYSAVGPGLRRRLRALSEPFGALIMAGEHVNGSGTMNGAIATGLEAAAQAMHLL